MPHLVLYRGLPPAERFWSDPAFQSVRTKRTKHDRKPGECRAERGAWAIDETAAVGLAHARQSWELKQDPQWVKSGQGTSLLE